MNAIVAVCRDWGIGHSGTLLVRNRADMASFVARTTGGTVIMGRSTLESLPGGRPLRNRRNIVLTHGRAPVANGVECAAGVDEALAAVAGDDPERVWVIGGESVYRQLLPHCARVYVTRNECVLPADAYFPNLDEDPSWRVESRAPGGVTADGVAFSFVTYARSR